MDDPSLRLLAALAEDDGAPLARLRKRSDLPMSSLLRAASELSALGLVRREVAAGRDCLHLTEQGRQLCQTS